MLATHELNFTRGDSYQPLGKEIEDWVTSFCKVREMLRNDRHLSADIVVKSVNTMIRIAAYIATPLAAVASVYLAIAVSIPLALAGIALTVLIHDTYQVTRAFEYQDEKMDDNMNLSTIVFHTLVLKHVVNCF